MKRIGMLYNTKGGKFVFVNLDYNKKVFQIINKDTNEDITNKISQTERAEITKFLLNYNRENGDNEKIIL